MLSATRYYTNVPYRPLGIRASAGAAAIALSFLTGGALASGLPAFPGAEGFGASATGGRDGRVIYVTTLATSGPGSLQWALDQPGKRYVLFKVSGLINGLVHLRRGDVTIAGETSPAGITVRGFVTDEQPFQDQAVQPPGRFAENWILRNIRMRPGTNGPDGDGLRLRYTRNAIVDGVSIGNAVDEAVEISYSNNITLQRSILAETLGGHAFYGGLLMNYSNPRHGFALDRISLHHNAFIRIMGRLPEASRESRDAAFSRQKLEIANNLYWDPAYMIALGANTNIITGANGNPYPIYTDLNMVGNRMVVRPSFPYGMFDDAIARRTPAAPLNRLFVRDNSINRYPTRADYQLFFCCNDFASGGPDTSPIDAQRRLTRHPFPSITYHRAVDLRTFMIANAGAFPRDPMDRRLTGYLTANAIAATAQNRNPAGDTLRPAFSGLAPRPPADTDADGMPDAWETAKGLDPRVAGANARTLSTRGYTDLEVYLHERAGAIRTQ